MGNVKGVQLLGLALSAAVFAGCASDTKVGGPSDANQIIPGATKWGHYDGEPVTKWNPDGRTMTLLTELHYTDPKGKSGPLRLVRSSMGHPFRGIFGR